MSIVRGGVLHLARRWATSLSQREPSIDDRAWASEVLGEVGFELWSAMPVADRRHSIEVARRFVALAPEAPRSAVAGALLHDVGKTASGLGTVGRVVATLVGRRTERFRTYHDHERIGAAQAERAGLDPVTTELIAGSGPWVAALHSADDV